MPVCPQCGSENGSPARFCGQCGASLPDPPRDEPEADPWIGRIVDKRYRVLSLIGSGGMGLVYRVEHIQLGKIAAMKVLHADTARDADAVRRFRTEAQAVSRLSHPNIVQTFDFGQSDGSLYLVMEYVRGDDLANLINREGPLPFSRAAPLFVQICSALTDAHEAGVIHRDLKPENIVVVHRGAGAAHAKVLDFGLAKLRERTDGAEITSRGQVIGTPYYMSPEQVRSEVLDVRTDIYSLGATFYRVLTGTPPFQAPTPVGILAMHITDALEPPRSRAPDLNLPAAADAIVARAMAKARDDRYATAAEVQHDLEVAIRDFRQAGFAEVDGDTAPALAVRGATASAMAQTVAVKSENVPRAVRASGQRAAVQGDADELSGDTSSGTGERLRKEDFDAYEQSLHRKKLITKFTLPALLVVLLSVGLWAFRGSGEKPSSVEREPNNSAREATLIPLDIRVQGNIGKSQSGGQPDMDYFRVPGGEGGRVLSARVEGIPAVDLVLELFDGAGGALAKSDANGAGRGEWLQPVSIGPSEAYLLVRQVWIQGTELVEEAPDPYRLSVHWGPPTPGWELEPNDWRDRATPVEVGPSVKGYLGNVDDKDWFVVSPAAAGYLVVRVSAPGGVEVAVSVADMPVKPNRTGELRIPVKAGEPTHIGLTRKQPAGADPKSDGVVGLDAPYEMRLELRTAQ